MKGITYPTLEFSFDVVINNYSGKPIYTNTSHDLTTGLVSIKSLDVVIYLTLGRSIGKQVLLIDHYL